MRVIAVLACVMLAGAAWGLSVESELSTLAEVTAESLESSQIERRLAWAAQKFHEMPPRHEIKQMLGEATTCLGEAKGTKFAKNTRICMHTLAVVAGAKRRASKKKIKKLKKKHKKKAKKAKKKAKKAKKKAKKKKAAARRRRRVVLALLEEDQSDFLSDAEEGSTTRLQHTLQWVRSRKEQMEKQLGESTAADKVCLNSGGKGAGAEKVRRNCMMTLSSLVGKKRKATKKKVKKLKKKHKKAVKKHKKAVKKAKKVIKKAAAARRRRSSRRRRWRL